MIAESIKISRSARFRRIHKCEVFDAAGNLLCELPLTGASISLDNIPSGRAVEKATLELHSFRVRIVDEADDA